MLSSGYYIESGFNEIDSPSNDIITDIIQIAESGLQETSSSFDDDEEKEMQDKLNAMLYMTINYYKTDVTVTKTDTKLSDVNDINTAQTILIAQRCQSSYIDFMKKVEELKTKFDNVPEYTNTVDITEQQWKIIVNQYNQVRKKLAKEMDVYASIKYAFLYGMGIDLCTGSASPDEKLLVRKFVNRRKLSISVI
jgi:hypothetical protein